MIPLMHGWTALERTAKNNMRLGIGQVIRTTHIVGLVSDMGIELGKVVYINWGDGNTLVRANCDKLRRQGKLIAGLVGGGLAAALGFKYPGFISTVPLALLLLLLVLRPLWTDKRICLEAHGH